MAQSEKYEKSYNRGKVEDILQGQGASHGEKQVTRWEPSNRGFNFPQQASGNQ